MCFNFLSKFKKTNTIIPPIIEKVMPFPLVKKDVNGNYVYNVLNKALPTAPHIYISDNSYKLCSKADMEAFLAYDDTDKRLYVGEWYDCDDFTYRLMGQLSVPEWEKTAYGTIWTDAHAFMCFIDDTGKLWFIEPQTDTLFDTWQLYFGSEIQFVEM